MSVRQIGDGSTQVGGITVNTPYENAEDKGVKVEDFLQLMIAQLTNQDFMNPVDDTQYVTQLAQFATMQSMQELSHYSQSNYVMGLVGKTVTAASYALGGNVSREVGVVSKVNFSGDEFTVTVNGKEFKLAQIMYVNDSSLGVDQNALDVAKKMTLIKQNVTDTTAALRWESPVSDEVASSGLRYDVYYTTNGQVDFNDLSTVKQGTKLAESLPETSYTLRDLDPDTTYFVNVVVKAPSGEESVYQHSVVRTASAD